MTMNRRLFLLSWLFQTRTSKLQVEVIEVFMSADGPGALLIHHANEETRDAFSRWVRANSGAQISLQLPNGSKIDGRIFRVNLCFGRGLILTRSTVATRPKDILEIV
jgi:hypothetical protein